MAEQNFSRQFSVTRQGMAAFAEKNTEANRKQVQDLYNQLKVMINERTRKQKLKAAYDHAMDQNQEFKDFQTEVMMIAPKEMPKLMLNKYATKTGSAPVTPMKQGNAAKQGGQNSSGGKKGGQDVDDNLIGNKRSRMSLKKQNSVALPQPATSLGLTSKKRDTKQMGRKEQLSSQKLLTRQNSSSQSSSHNMSGKLPVLSKRTSKIMQNSQQSLNRSQTMAVEPKLKTQFSSGGLGLMGKERGNSTKQQGNRSSASSKQDNTDPQVDTALQERNNGSKKQRTSESDNGGNGLRNHQDQDGMEEDEDDEEEESNDDDNPEEGSPTNQDDEDDVAKSQNDDMSQEEGEENEEEEGEEEGEEEQEDNSQSADKSEEVVEEEGEEEGEEEVEEEEEGEEKQFGEAEEESAESEQNSSEQVDVGDLAVTSQNNNNQLQQQNSEDKVMGLTAQTQRKDNDSDEEVNADDNEEDENDEENQEEGNGEGGEDEQEEQEDEMEEENETSTKAARLFNSKSSKKQASARLGDESEQQEENFDHEQEEIKKQNQVDNEISSEEDSDNDDEFDEQNPESQLKNWKSNLIKSGQGSFLQPQQLIDKVELIKARYGLQQVDSDCFGLLVDQTEQFMRDIVIQLIAKSRVRNQDAQKWMSNTKPGDQCDLTTVTYVSEAAPQAFRIYGQGGAANNFRRPMKEVAMFNPKESSAVNLICSENSSKEFSYLLNNEYSNLREKQEMQAHQAEILKAKEQEQKDAGEKQKQDEANKGGSAQNTTGASVLADSQGAGVQLDEKSKLKLKQKRLEAKKRSESLLDRGMSTQGAFDHFLAGKKKTTDEADGNDTNQASGNIKRFNKMAPEGLIGKPDTKKKEVVILSKKSVVDSFHDVSTISKKVIMKDLLAVLKSDPRLAHKPLVYQLQNKAQ